METHFKHSADELGDTVDVEDNAGNTCEDTLNIKSLECLEVRNGNAEDSLNFCKDGGQNLHGNNLEVG